MRMLVTILPSMMVQIPLPRKGTETVVNAEMSVLECGFKFHYPARGRKRFWNEEPIGNSVMFKFHYPARGRKREVVSLADATIEIRFKFHYPARGRKRLDSDE